jgi:MFS transporter, OFA family, oxalate/formate antiporter
MPVRSCWLSAGARRREKIKFGEDIMSKRWIQFGSALVAMIMIANLQYAWTLFTGPLRAGHPAWTLTDVGFAFTIFIFLETWITPVEGWLIDRLGPRLFLTAGGILVGIGWTSMGYAQTLTQLYIFYGLAGVGAAFVYSGSIATALKWFPDMRGRVSGFITAGFGAGSGLFIPTIIAPLLAHSGYKAAFLYTGIGQGLLIVIAAQMLHNPGPDFQVSPAAKKPISPRIRRNTLEFNSGQMMATPHFWVLYVAFVLTSIGGLMITAQASPVGRSLRIATTAIVAAVAWSRIANGAGRIIWGWFSDLVGRELAMVIPFTLQSLCLLGMITVGRLSGTWFVVMMVLVFFTWGSMFSLFPAIIGDYFGPRCATSNYGFLYTAKGVASIGGGGIAAALYTHYGSWNVPVYWTAGLTLVSAVLILGLRILPLPGQRRLEKPALVTAKAS